MKQNFEQRKQNRIQFAKRQAEKNKMKADALYNQAKEINAVIPLGQPIMIGHHSEQKDRNFRNRIHNTYGKAFEAMDKAAYYEEKAKTIESNDAIASDDPMALEKLTAKLNALQAAQEFMKQANKCIRKQDRDTFLKLPDGTPERWEQINTPDVMGCRGFAHYKLQNNNANINRIKGRVLLLEKMATKATEEIEIKGVRLVQNVEANRIQLVFPGKPSEEHRKKLKSNGFRWSPSQGAWQRHLTPAAIRIARQLLNEL